MKLLNNYHTASHHADFLKDCKHNGIMPRGLRLHLEVNVIGHPDHMRSSMDALKGQIDAEIKQTETKILDMLIAYYSSLSRDLDHDSTVLQQAMEDTVASSPTMTAALDTHRRLVQSTETKASIKAKEREATRQRKLYRLRQEKQENRVPARTSRPRR